MEITISLYHAVRLLSWHQLADYVTSHVTMIHIDDDIPVIKHRILH
jgi:hypothetical protein